MKNLDISKTEYIKFLKNRSISIKTTASKHKILKLINNLTNEDFTYLLKLRNIKIDDDDDSIKTIVNALAKHAHKKKINNSTPTTT